MPLVECVPNFSEGRRVKVIEQIAQAICSVDHVHLLHTDRCASANRTVMTVMGEPEFLLEAVYRGIKVASQLIDMRCQTGTHPRMGAIDVCPLVPWQDITMQKCIELSENLAKRVGEELAIPVYLYAQAAKQIAHRSLAFLRKGEYEGLAKRMKSGFLPDYGPPTFNESSGVTAIGARDIMVAYNVDLSTTDVAIAKKIALDLRKLRDQGELLPLQNGSAADLSACAVLGWFSEERKITQVSFNLFDFTRTQLQDAHGAVAKLAQAYGVQVIGSEIVGLVPLRAILNAGQYYLRKDGESVDAYSEDIYIMVAQMGLQLKDFQAKEKVLEYCLVGRDF